MSDGRNLGAAMNEEGPGRSLQEILNPVNLGAAGKYVIYAGGAFTTAAFRIMGNIGVGRSTDELKEAVTDMQAAYEDASSRPTTTDKTFDAAVSFGSKIFDAPGIYKVGGAVNYAANAIITLVGEVTDMFIFQSGGTFTFGESVEVVLEGGLVAENVYWVGTSAAVGPNTHMEGTFLASGAVTIASGVTMNGIILAQGVAASVLENLKTTISSHMRRGYFHSFKKSSILSIK